MVFARINPGKPGRFADPFERVVPPRIDAKDGFEPADAAKVAEAGRRLMRTFAGFGIAEARHLVVMRPEVIIREDPMFGRRGYAREVIPDEKEGFLVLVIAYTSRPDPRTGQWSEPVKPRDCDRRFWAPSRVEFRS